MATAAQAQAQCSFSRGFQADEDLRKTAPPYATTFEMSHFLMETTALLFQRTLDGSRPELARETQFDPETGRLRVTLDASCRWSDGERISPENFRDGLRLIFDPKNESYIAGRNLFRNGEAVYSGEMPFDALGFTQVDDSTFDLFFDAPEDLATSVLNFVGYAPLPSHKLKADPGYLDNYARSDMVVSGPYMFGQVDGTTYHLKPNPYYCEGKHPNFDDVTIHLGVNPNEQANLLVEGKLDLIGRAPAPLVEMLSTNPAVGERFSVDSVHDEVLYYFAFNQADERWADPSLRRAVLKALDQQMFSRPNVGYFIEPADSLAFRYPGYDPQPFQWFSEDYADALEDARKTMAEAGYGPDNRMEIVVLAPPREIYRYLANAMQSMLSQVYIDPQIVVPEDSVIWREMMYNSTDDKPTIRLSGWGSDYSDPENFLSNFVQWVPEDGGARAKVSALIDESSRQAGHEERMRLLEDAEYLMRDSGYIYPIAWLKTPWIVKKTMSRDRNFYFLARTMHDAECDDQDSSKTP